MLPSAEELLADAVELMLRLFSDDPDERTGDKLRQLADLVKVPQGAEFSSETQLMNKRAEAWLAVCAAAKAVTENSPNADQLLNDAVDKARAWKLSAR